MALPLAVSWLYLNARCTVEALTTNIFAISPMRAPSASRKRCDFSGKCHDNRKAASSRLPPNAQTGTDIRQL